MLAQRRLRKEAEALRRNPPELIRAKPDDKNLYDFHFVIEGTPGTPYEGGFYHGILKFPREYPMRPPGVKLLTPSGRFETNQRLCLSISDYHPESWNPMWSCEKVLLGLQSFMATDEVTAGSMRASTATKRKHARNSLQFNCRNAKFRKLFPELVELYRERCAAAANETEKPPTLPAPSAGAATSGPGASPAAATDKLNGSADTSGKDTAGSVDSGTGGVGVETKERDAEGEAEPLVRAPGEAPGGQGRENAAAGAAGAAADQGICSSVRLWVRRQLPDDPRVGFTLLVLGLALLALFFSEGHGDGAAMMGGMPGFRDDAGPHAPPPRYM